jgi:hypothetical protein
MNRMQGKPQMVLMVSHAEVGRDVSKQEPRSRGSVSAVASEESSAV